MRQGQLVRVYADPILRTKYVGAAVLLERQELFDCDGFKLSRWAVRWQSDREIGEAIFEEAGNGGHDEAGAQGLQG